MASISRHYSARFLPMRLKKQELLNVRISDMNHLKQRIRDPAEMVTWVWQELKC